MLVFQVDKLYSMLLSLDICSNQVLEALCVSACLLQELNESSQNMGIEFSYTPQVIILDGDLSSMEKWMDIQG